MPDTTPADVVVESSLPPLSVEKSEIPPDAQLQTEPNATECESSTAEAASEILLPCEAEVVEASAENEREEIVPEVSVQIEESDVDEEIPEKDTDDSETNCTDELNTESTSEVTTPLPTAQDESEGGDVVQNTEQLLSKDDAPATANDAPTETDENKDADVEQLQTADVSKNANDPTPTAPLKDNTPSVGLREILFTDQGWRELWAAIPDKQLSFTAPVLRVEAGRFFWSSETYNKR